MVRKLDFDDDEDVPRRVGVIECAADPRREMILSREVSAAVVDRTGQATRGANLWDICVRQMGEMGQRWGVAIVRDGHEYPTYGPLPDVGEAFVAALVLCWMTDSDRLVVVMQPFVETSPEEFVRRAIDPDIVVIQAITLGFDAARREDVVHVRFDRSIRDGGQDPDTVVHVLRSLEAIPGGWETRLGFRRGD